LTGRTRAEQKAAAVLRAQLGLKQALERIDFAHDVIKPKLLEIRELEAGNTVEIGPGDALSQAD
jgi:hypothetical protein